MKKEPILLFMCCKGKGWDSGDFSKELEVIVSNTGVSDSKFRDAPSLIFPWTVIEPYLNLQQIC